MKLTRITIGAALHLLIAACLTILITRYTQPHHSFTPAAITPEMQLPPPTLAIR